MWKHTIIFLGWNSSTNEYWLQNFVQEFNQEFDVCLMYYDHWKNWWNDIDFEKELKNLEFFINKNNIKNYSIVAKSAGFVLSLIWISKNIIKPKNIIWLWLPLEYIEFRKINIQKNLKEAFWKTNILLIHADQDPQWWIFDVRKTVSDNFPIFEIIDNTHKYDNFSFLSKIIKTFIQLHQTSDKNVIQKIEAVNIEDIIKIIESNIWYKFLLKNNWIFDVNKKIFTVQWNDKKYIFKKWKIKNLKKEIENSKILYQKINNKIIGNRKICIIPQKLYQINNDYWYLISEYVWPDYNDVFYEKINQNLKENDFLELIKLFYNHNILHKDLLPRNFIINDKNIYLFDFENITFIDSYCDIYNYNTSIFIAWYGFFDKNFIESILLKPNNNYVLNDYEKIFLEAFWLEYWLKSKEICHNILKKFSIYNRQEWLLKIDDILHSLSWILPMEIEVFLDLILLNNNQLLYKKLSNLIEISRLKLYVNKNQNELSDYIIENIRSILLGMLSNNWVISRGL